jgi:hypothetical protein
LLVTLQGTDSETDAILAKLKPAPSAKCTVKIEGAALPIAGAVVCTGRQRRADPHKHHFRNGGNLAHARPLPDGAGIEGMLVVDGTRDVSLSTGMPLGIVGTGDAILGNSRGDNPRRRRPVVLLKKNQLATRLPGATENHLHKSP